MSESIIAYHFVGNKLRDGRAVPKDGEWLIHNGPVEICKLGLHASLHPFDALQFAPGPVLCKVEVRGVAEYQPDKLVATERCIIKRFDATDLLRTFARKCALDVIHLWDAPDIVKKYLESGDETIRAAARAAAWAAGAAAWAAGAAARAAAWAAWAAGAAAGAAEAAEAAAWAGQRERFSTMVTEAFEAIQP